MGRQDFTRTYSSTDGHEYVADNLGVIHHDGLHCAVQHADLQRPLLLLVLQSVLAQRGDKSVILHVKNISLSNTSEQITLDTFCHLLF